MAVLKKILNGLSETSETSFAAGDVIFYNKDDRSFYAVEYVDDTTWDSYPAGKWVPVGLLVTPSDHDIYGDGSVSAVSLKYMRYDSPDSGGEAQTMYWGFSGSSVPGLSTYPNSVYVGTTLNQTTDPSGSTSFVYLPSDNFEHIDIEGVESIQCITDPKAWYYYQSTSERHPAPSPYLEDGSRNPAYCSTADNALASYTGEDNTDVILSHVTGQSGWRTDAAVTNSTGSGYAPAACCCWRYHTEGTEQGEWYLPSTGEIGYFGVRLGMLNRILKSLHDKYGSEYACSGYVTDNTHWTSTPVDVNDTRGLDTKTMCDADSKTRNTGYYVLAYKKFDTKEIKTVERLKNLVYCKTEDGFDYKTEDGVIQDPSIVFVEELRRVWTHDTFFPDIYDGIVVFTIVPDPSDATVIINGKERTSIELWYGDTVEWSVSKGGYVSQEGTLTLTTDTELQVTLERDQLLGVYVGYTDNDGVNRICDPKDWDSSLGQAQGILVGNGNYQVLVAPEESTKYWSSGNSSITGCTLTTDSDEAQADYMGKDNTEAIVAKGDTYASDAYAAGWCNQYSYGNKGAGEWYLPACGELSGLLAAYYSDINTALGIIGGTSLRSGQSYWSSTVYASNSAWTVTLSSGSTGHFGKTANNYYVRPVSTFDYASEDGGGDDGKLALSGTFMIKISEIDGYDGQYTDYPLSSYTGSPTLRVTINSMLIHASIDVGAEFVSGNPYTVGSKSSTIYVRFTYDFTDLYEEMQESANVVYDLNLVYSTYFTDDDRYNFNVEIGQIIIDKGVVSDYFTAD